jgi:hypothetical protein
LDKKSGINWRAGDEEEEGKIYILFIQLLFKRK